MLKTVNITDIARRVYHCLQKLLCFEEQYTLFPYYADNVHKFQENSLNL